MTQWWPRKCRGSVVCTCDVLPAPGEHARQRRGALEAAVRDLGDVVVFIDSDFIDIGPHYVTGLVGPLLYELDVWFVKAFYNRPMITESGVRPTGGGGVTELVARPLLNLYWPQLASVMQPLAGECAWRAALEHLLFASGYGWKSRC